MTMIELVEGRTEPIDLILKISVGGVWTALNLTGKEVALVLKDRDGASIVVDPGDVVITDASAGAVRYSPASTSTLTNALSPLSVHWRVRTTSTGKDFHIPTGAGDTWKIHKQ
jgi:hypothetical protein